MIDMFETEQKLSRSNILCVVMILEPGARHLQSTRTSRERALVRAHTI